MKRSIVQRTADRLATAETLSDILPKRIGPGDVPPALEGGPFQCLDSDVGQLWMRLDDEVIRPYVARTGTWEPEEGRLLRTLIRPGCRFLDVGANIGYFSLFAANCAAGVRIDAVEPVPINIAALRMNLWVNDVRATVWPLALSAGDRHVSMSITPTNLGDSRADVVSADPDQVFDLVAPAMPGDELFAGRRFDVIKLDVQGFELDVLLGMADVLRRSPGVAVVSEFWPDGLHRRGLDPGQVLSEYRAFGFSVQAHVADQLRPVTNDEALQLCHSAGPDGQVNLLLHYDRRV